MAARHSQAASADLLNLVIGQGARQLHQNRIVKRYANKYSTWEALSFSNEMCLHAGIQQQTKRKQMEEESPPCQLRTDILCCRSVPVSRAQADSSRAPGNKAVGPEKSTGRRSSLGKRDKQSQKSAQSSKQNKLIPVQDADSQRATGRFITERMRNEQHEIQNLRKEYLYRDGIRRRQRQMQKQLESQKQTRVAELKQKINSFAQQKDNTVTYDCDGSFICVQPKHQTQALKRRYPPSKVTFQFEPQAQDSFPGTGEPSIKQRAAKGQAFASTIMKTLNMSKHSLNFSAKNGVIDELEYMKRNDMFNNNHSRQVTTIPFLQIGEGTQYTQSNFNHSLGTKRPAQRTSRSESGSRFRSHSHLDKARGQSSANNIQQEEEVPVGKVAQSSRPYLRPKTSAPRTPKTADRITTGDKKLVSELIQ